MSMPPEVRWLTSPQDLGQLVADADSMLNCEIKIIGFHHHKYYKETNLT